MDRTEPLAYRLRPQTLGDVMGQEHLLASGKPLRAAIEKDELRSVILSGPPGIGKTSLAQVIAKTTKAEFVALNATSSGVKELKAVCEDAAGMRERLGSRTVLFIDEIHRFNAAQQDALLPYVEKGDVILIGATTENPYFEVQKALVSRSQVCLLQPLSEENLTAILRRALTDSRGFAGKVHVSDEAISLLARRSNGDARTALNSLELAAMTAGGKVTLEEAQAVLSTRRSRFDATGEEHYNVISAFIKTLRGSDADAALLWLFLALEGGEEPRFLFRRMAILASEDIGMADPEALKFVTSAWNAFEMVGLPEGEFFLAHACVYLALAPKSNAVTRAMGTAKSTLKEASTAEVPNHLRNAPVKGMAEQGYGAGYQYPHNLPAGIATANYFPVGILPKPIYEPSEHGLEPELRKRMEYIKKVLGR
jgi:putative ATPase